MMSRLVGYMESIQPANEELKSNKSSELDGRGMTRASCCASHARPERRSWAWMSLSSTPAPALLGASMTLADVLRFFVKRALTTVSPETTMDEDLRFLISDDLRGWQR